MKTPNWVLEGFNSEEEYNKKKGIKIEKKSGKTFKLKRCPKCKRDEVSVVVGQEKRGNHILNIVYFGEVVGGCLKEPDGQEILDLNVFSYEEIYGMELKRELRSSTHKSLEDYLFKGHEYPLNIIRTLFSQ